MVDNSEDILNILEKEKLKQELQQVTPKSPGAFLRTTPTASPKISIYHNDNMNEMDNLNIDNIIEEHLKMKKRGKETATITKITSITRYQKQIESNSNKSKFYE